MTTPTPDVLLRQAAELSLKPLSEVTREDAMAILKTSFDYDRILSKNRWEFTDESADLGEPTKRLYARHSQYIFWFHNDSIDCDDKEREGLLTPYDVKLECYLKAHELGYYVPGLSDGMRPTEIATKDLLGDIISWEKDLSEYMSLETILNERYHIYKKTNQ